ncbi:MAG: hypothetical protein KC488_14630 [Candidatus Cloacimonetes bacterium]|nr:hypothetical protein [Candidatus Cloacimonadota bacterium]
MRRKSVPPAGIDFALKELFGTLPGPGRPEWETAQADGFARKRMKVRSNEQEVAGSGPETAHSGRIWRRMQPMMQ